MNWRALVPIKSMPDRKTRLANRLSRSARMELTDAMLRHVLSVLAQTKAVADITLLSAQPVEGWDGHRIDDGGRGLNAELSHAACAIGNQLLVIHADLPLLSCDDVNALLEAAEGGVAIAPDRHGLGTNALALAVASKFRFSFGRDSFACHFAAVGSNTPVIRRNGLMMDVDEPADLDAVASVMRAMPCQSHVSNIVMSLSELVPST